MIAARWDEIDPEVDGVAEAAVAQYGLVDAAQDLDAPLTEGFLCALLVNGFGAEISTDTPDLVMTRGDLAKLFSQYFAQ